MKFILTSIMIMLMSGCAVINNLNNSPALGRCLHPSLPEKQHNICELTPWVDFWLQANTLNWKERKLLLARLTSSPADRVKSFLLSHVPNTPYQTRLRAQLVAQQFMDNNEGRLARFIKYVVFLPAQEKLELESALTTQTQFNISQEKQLQIQREKISEQELQLRKLLQIEKNIVEKPTEVKP